MDEYKLIRVRSGRWAKMVNGEVVGMATYGEWACQVVREIIPGVEIGVIEVNLALTVIIALITENTESSLVRLMGSLGFAGSLIPSIFLTWAFVLVRLPTIYTLLYNCMQAMLGRGYPKPSISRRVWLVFCAAHDVLEKSGLAIMVEIGYIGFGVAPFWAYAMFGIYLFGPDGTMEDLLRQFSI